MIKEKYYILFVDGDIEPSLIGPFDTSEERNKKARKLKLEYGDDHGIFWMDQGPTLGNDVATEVGSYSGEFFDICGVCKKQIKDLDEAGDGDMGYICAPCLEKD